MKQKALVLSILLSTSMMANAINMQLPDAQDADWYYDLGGEKTVSAPLSSQTNSIVLGGSAKWGMGSSCGAFDPTLGIANTLNGVKSGIDSFQQQLVGAATSAISSLPLLILQRANPGLYDMLMSSMSSAQTKLSLSTKNCENAMAEIGKGDNPYEDWVTVSRTRDWQTEMGGGNYKAASNDVNTAKENVEKANGENGVTWIEGQDAGGRNQPPINIPTDVVKAGYNTTLNRSAGSSAAAPQNGSRMVDLWKTPQDAQAFSRSLLGESKISTYNNHPVQSLPGRGISFEIDKEVESLSPKFDGLLSGDTEINYTSLKDISAPNILVTGDIIHTLQGFSPSKQSILKNKLIQEIATARTVERALLLRRLILTGQQDPNVSASGVGVEASQSSVDRLTMDINNVMFEIDVNKKLASSTGQTIRAIGQNDVRIGTSTRIGSSERAVMPVSGAIMQP